MGFRQRFVGLRRPWHSGHALFVILVVLIVVITVVDILIPADVPLGPLLVIASAITASFAGPLLTGVIGVLAVAAQAFFGWHFGVLFSRDTPLLYTDGVVEARDQDGAFYLFSERAAQWTDNTPETLLHHLRRDLLAHPGGRRDDDAALIAVRRMPTRHAGRHHGKPVSRASELRSWNQM